MDWFLYDRDFSHERVKDLTKNEMYHNIGSEIILKNSTAGKKPSVSTYLW